jgi:hypothetical protein
MINQLTNKGNKTILTIPLAVMIAVSFGCASQKAADMKPHKTKHITDIIISENSESLIFTIKGDQSLTYSADKQLSPIGVMFNFPDTTLDIPKQVYIPPENEIISSIEANEIVEDKTTTSRIFIALRKDTLYDLIPDEAELQITFPKAIAFSNDTKPQKELAEKKPELKLTQKSLPAATRLTTVTATPLKNNVAVDVKTDGAIRNYKSFTIDNPARIVFDMYNLKSPYRKEQIIVVESKWIKRIRHFSYPDKVRLVLDTHKEYLSKYSAHPTDTGLLIHVGKIPAVPDNASQTFLDDNLGTQQVTLTWDNVPNATSYNVYWSNFPGVTKRNGNKISAENNSAIIKGLKRGTTYYFVVTTVNDSEESEESEEISFTVGQ